MKKQMMMGMLALSTTAVSAIFQVDLTVQDQIDGNPGDGICAIPTGGFCTLRAAVMEANALAGPDVIVLPGDSTIRLNRQGNDENAAVTGDLDITDAVVIGTFVVGTVDYPSVDANELNDRVFHVQNGAGEVTFVNFKIINGAADFANGGGINISLDNTVNVERVWFEDNTADSGGAVYANPLSELNIVDSVFKGNAAVSQGAAITTFAATELNQSTVYENINFNADFQEAIYVGPAAFGDSFLNVRNSTLFENNGSGVYAQAADLSLRNVTIANNSGRGVVSNPNEDVSPDFRVRNSLFFDNQLNCVNGGGVNLITDNWNFSSDNSGCFILGGTNVNEADPKVTGLKVDFEHWHRYYRPGFFSPLVDAAHPAAPGPGIGCEGQDQRGIDRAQDGDGDGDERCDIGAIELIDDLIFFDDYDITYAIQQ